jgi:uncharacterized protein YjbI with pentapeptide repeats
MMAEEKKQGNARRWLQDEFYINAWRWLKEKTQGHRVVIVFFAVLILIGLAIAIIDRTSPWPHWTGISDREIAQNTVPGKTAWDLADLLLVPLALALFAYFFNKRQKEYELEIAQKEREQEREIARERVEETALQNYLDKMTELLLPPNYLRESEEDSEVRSIARSRTLTVLRGLNGDRKGSVIRFLHESKLIDADKTIINLRTADLGGADLIGADLSGADLSGANLTEAILSGANLSGANLSQARLTEVILWHANLTGADLGRANLLGADLLGANLTEANLTEAFLRRANLSRANLSGANLTEAALYVVRYNNKTIWPDGYDPKQAGAINEDENE